MKFETFSLWANRFIRAWWVFVTIYDAYLLYHGRLMMVSAFSWCLLTVAILFSLYVERTTKRLVAQAEETRRMLDEVRNSLERSNKTIDDANARLRDIKWDSDG